MYRVDYFIVHLVLDNGGQSVLESENADARMGRVL